MKDRLYRHLKASYIRTTLGLVVAISIVDSLFDEAQKAWGFTSVDFGLAFAVYVLAHIALFALAARIFFKASAKRLTAEEERVRGEQNLLFSDLAHDLKTPLTTIIGNAKAFTDGKVDPDSEQGRAFLATIRQRGETMNELLDIMLDYTKLRDGRVTLNKRDVDLAELVCERVAGLYQGFEDKRLGLELDLPKTRVPVKVDKIQFARAVDNLLVNAQKHNATGGKVGMFLRQKEGGWELAVADDGDPLGDIDLATLTLPFFKQDDSRNVSGSGLGLAITQTIAERHGFGFELVRFDAGDWSKAFVIRIPT